MKKILVTLLIALMATVASAEEAKFSVTFPMETGATAFWFPSDRTYAMGLAHTFMRVKHTSLPKLQLDFDATIAQEVNNEKDTLAGVGIKLGYKPASGELKGFAFEPSLGVTALNNWAKSKIAKEILQNYRIAVYGTILLYRW